MQTFPLKTYKMPKNQTYSLDIPGIEQSAKLFVENLGADYTFSFEDDQKCKTITIRKGKENGILKCFIVQGQVSFQVQGKHSMNKITDECKNEIIKNTKIEFINKKR